MKQKDDSVMTLNVKRTLVVGFAFMGIMCFWEVYDYIMPLILNRMFGLNATQYGLVMGLDNLLAIFLLPFFGHLSDKYTKAKYGRRTTFIVIGTLCAVVFMVVMIIIENVQFEDVMAAEVGFLKYCMDLLGREYAGELERLGVELPQADQIPVVRFDQAKRLAAEKYGRPIRDPFDLEPEEEHNIGRYFKEEYGADFVFVTHYPTKKRPFYAMDDPEDPCYTLSFDLLFRGMEVTTGGQRIHDYHQQVAKMERLGMDPAEFESYLMLHKYGAPPHGGLGIGLERLTMQLCGLDNVRKACLFPRDRTRLEP